MPKSHRLRDEARGWLRALGFKSFHENPSKSARIIGDRKPPPKTKYPPGYYRGQIEHRIKQRRATLDAETREAREHFERTGSFKTGRRKPRKSKLKSKQGLW